MSRTALTFLRKVNPLGSKKEFVCLFVCVCVCVFMCLCVGMMIVWVGEAEKRSNHV